MLAFPHASVGDENRAHLDASRRSQGLSSPLVSPGRVGVHASPLFSLNLVLAYNKHKITFISSPVKDNEGQTEAPNAFHYLFNLINEKL